MTSSIIRPYQPGDAAGCARLYAAVQSAAISDPTAGWQSRLAPLVCPHVLLLNGKLLGFAAANPVPGLPGLADLFGFIAPPHRRQGLGTQLLEHLCVWLPAAGVSEISVSVPNLQTPLARFLQRRQFQLHHEEWQLRCDLAGKPVPQPVDNSLFSGDNRGVIGENYPLAGDNPPKNEPLYGENAAVTGDKYRENRGKEEQNLLKMATFPRERAISLFLQLYEASFAQTPWYQPYTRAETAALLDDPAAITFLLRAGIPIGFIWSSLQPGGIMEIEPVGIVRRWQGQGYGRWFLTGQIRDWREGGVTAVRLGVWRANEAARRLYARAGFRHTTTSFFLHRTL